MMFSAVDHRRKRNQGCHGVFHSVLTILHPGGVYWQCQVPIFWYFHSNSTHTCFTFYCIFHLHLLPPTHTHTHTQLFFKLLAFGPIGYFHSWRNLFDLLLVFLSVAFSLRSLVYLSSGSGVRSDDMLFTSHVSSRLM